MKKIIVAVAVLLAVTLNSIAQVPPPPTSSSNGAGGGSTPSPGLPAFLPIGNLGVLKAYAEDRLAHGELQISSPAILSSGESQIIEARGNGAQEVIRNLMNQHFSFNLSQADAQAWLYVNLADQGGQTLFTGYKQSRFSPQTGHIVWLADSGVQADLVNPVPIFVPGLASARVVVTNGLGQVIADPGIIVRNDYLLYPTNLVGRPGSLILGINGPDGQVLSIALNLSDGKMVSPTPAVAFVSIGIKGDYDFGVNPGGIGLYSVPDIGGSVVRFSVKLNPQQTTLYIKVGGFQTDGLAPIGFLFRWRPDDNSSWPPGWVYNTFPSGFNGSWGFGGGEWEIVYILTPTDLTNVPLLPPNYYGGDGRG